MTGTARHTFTAGAIEQAALAIEQRAAFVDAALTARDAMRKTCTGYDADEVHAYIKARIEGGKPAMPKARSWRV